MALTQTQMYRIQLNGILSSLKTASEKQKTGHISIHMAKSFNNVLEGIKKEFAEIGSNLPAKIDYSSSFSALGIAEITYLDLEIYCNTVIGMLDSVDK